MRLHDLDGQATRHGLTVMGALHPDAPDIGTLILIGTGTGFWPVFTASVEYRDTDPDPLDRWSKRVIPALAPDRGRCLYPSDGPPYLPFIRWAEETGRFFQSPTGMLVHDAASLMISIRAAIALPDRIALPPVTSANPCTGCAAPCTTACPVAALSATAPYDVPACKTYLATAPGLDCMTLGCAARRACPVSQQSGRDPSQSAFHMAAFKG